MVVPLMFDSPKNWTKYCLLCGYPINWTKPTSGAELKGCDWRSPNSLKFAKHIQYYTISNLSEYYSTGQ